MSSVFLKRTKQGKKKMEDDPEKMFEKGSVVKKSLSLRKVRKAQDK